jgi:4-oxalocrotonate tautomerase
MPHVVIKLQSGRSAQQKARLAELLTQAVMDGAGCGEAAVSVRIEDVAPGDWTERVYKPDIAAHWDELTKKPGYKPV